MDRTDEPGRSNTTLLVKLRELPLPSALHHEQSTPPLVSPLRTHVAYHTPGCGVQIAPTGDASGELVLLQREKAEWIFWTLSRDAHPLELLVVLCESGRLCWYEFASPVKGAVGQTVREVVGVEPVDGTAFAFGPATRSAHAELSDEAQTITPYSIPLETLLRALHGSGSDAESFDSDSVHWMGATHESYSRHDAQVQAMEPEMLNMNVLLVMRPYLLICVEMRSGGSLTLLRAVSTRRSSHLGESDAGDVVSCALRGELSGRESVQYQMGWLFAVSVNDDGVPSLDIWDVQLGMMLSLDIERYCTSWNATHGASSRSALSCSGEVEACMQVHHAGRWRGMRVCRTLESVALYDEHGIVLLVDVDWCFRMLRPGIHVARDSPFAKHLERRAGDVGELHYGVRVSRLHDSSGQVVSSVGDKESAISPSFAQLFSRVQESHFQRSVSSNSSRSSATGAQDQLHWFEDLLSDRAGDMHMPWLARKKASFAVNGFSVRSGSGAGVGEGGGSDVMTGSASLSSTNVNAIAFTCRIAEEQRVVDVGVSPSAVMVLSILRRDEREEYLFQFHERKTGILHRRNLVPRGGEGVAVLEFQDRSAYIAIDGGLHACVMQCSKEQLLNRLIMYGDQSGADALCALNEWDSRALRLHALKLGLKYRQLSVVQPALAILDDDQQFDATELVSTFVQSIVHSDPTFLESLVSIVISFVCGVLCSPRVREASSSFGTFRVESSATLPARKELLEAPTVKTPPNSPDEHLRYYSSVLQFLRNVQDHLTSTATDRTGSMEGISIEHHKRTQALAGHPLAVQDLALEHVDFNVVHRQWKDLEGVAIVREALLHDQFATASAYLRWRNDAVRLKSESAMADDHSINSEAVRRTSFCVVYQAVALGKLDDAKAMLEALAEEPQQHFREIAFHTTRRPVRNWVLKWLRENAPCNEDDDACARLSLELERYNPSTEYAETLTRLKAKPRRVGPRHRRHDMLSPSCLDDQEEESDEPIYTEIVESHLEKIESGEMEILSCGEVDDMSSEVLAQYGFVQLHAASLDDDIEAQAHGNLIGLPSLRAYGLSSTRSWGDDVTVERHRSDYYFMKLAWLRNIDNDMKERVLLEADPTRTSVSSDALLPYYAAHNDWHSMLGWLRRHAPKRPSDQDGSGAPSMPCSALFESLSLCCPFVRDMVLDEAARSGLFVHAIGGDMMPSVAADSITPESGAAVLPRLARMGYLFRGLDDGKGNVSPERSNDEEEQSQCHAQTTSLRDLLPHGEAGSSFHMYFVRVCAEHGLANLLQAYLDHYRLGNKKEHAQVLREVIASADEKPSPEQLWAQLLVELRVQGSISHASQLNGAILLQKEALFHRHQSLSPIEMIRNGRVLMALGTLLYETRERCQESSEPTSIQSMLVNEMEKVGSTWGSSTDNAWQTVRGSCAAYPTLEGALFPSSEEKATLAGKLDTRKLFASMIRTFQDHSGLRIASNASLDASMKRVASTERLGDLGVSSAAKGMLEIPEFSSPQFTRDAYHDDVDVTYFLADCQPLKAYEMHQLMLERREDLNVLELAYRIAISRIGNKSVTASCIAFLELCGLDTHVVRVHLNAARRVHTFLLWFSRREQGYGMAGNDLEIYVREKVEQLFFAVGTSKLSYGVVDEPMEMLHSTDTVQLVSSIDGMLSQAASVCIARALLVLSTHRIVKKGLFDIDGVHSEMDLFSVEEAKQSEEQLWRLVNLFCIAHHLPLETTYLIQLARSNDYVRLLFAAQAQSIPVETVIGIVREHVGSKPLREHLHTLLRRSNPSFDASVSMGEISGGEGVFNLFLNAQQSSTPLITLLQMAIRERTPLLVVLAASYYGDAAVPKHDSCSTADFLACWLCAQASVTLSDESRESVAKAVGGTQGQVGLLGSSRVTMTTLGEILLELISSKRILLVRRGLLLFDHRNKLFLNYLSFHQMFLQARYAQAKTQFGVFQKKLEEAETVSHGGRIGDAEWVKMIAFAATQRLLHTLPSDFEKGKLLSILAQSNVEGKYARQYATFQLVQRLGLEADVSCEPDDIVTLLLSKSLFDEARKYSIENGLNCDRVTIREVVLLMEQYQRGPIWSSPTERMKFWEQAQSLVLEHNCAPAVAGDLFYQLATEYQSCTLEHVQLLTLALEFFEKHNASCNAADAQPHEFMRDLEMRIMVLSSSAADTKEVELPTTPLARGGMDPAMMEKIIEPLLNTGQLEKAQALCDQFGHTSVDLQLLRTALDLANGVVKVQHLDNSIISAIRERDNSEVKMETSKDAIQVIRRVCKHGRENSNKTSPDFCRSVHVMHCVAEALDMTYRTISDHKDPNKLVSALLLRGLEHISLAQEFLELVECDASSIANIIGGIYFRAIIGEVVGSVDPNWSNAEFAEFVSVAKEPKDVGTYLMTQLSTNGKRMSFAHQAETLIRAHHCFVLACSIDAAQHVIRVTKRKVKDMVEAGEFSILVRLLTGIQNYRQLQFIFNALVENEEFERLLTKNAALKEDERIELRLALHRYLRTHHPEDSKKLHVMFLSFKMWREWAETLKDQADAELSNPGIDFKRVIGLYLDASDYFLKDRCFQMAMKCLAQLQYNTPEQKLLNLTKEQARRAMMLCSLLDNARIVAAAYDLDYSEEWLPPLYHQAVVRGNIGFAEDYIRMFQCAPSLWMEMTAKFRNDPQKQSNTHHFKQFLGLLDNMFVRYQLASELGFRDMMSPDMPMELYDEWRAKEGAG